MQSTCTRTITPRRLCKAIISPPSHKRNFGMMIPPFPHFPSSSSFFNAEDISPLFRLLDHPLHPSFSATRRWAQQPHHWALAPRFDVRERTTAYELQGELPGLQQKDVTIEFVDPHTLVIRGYVERDFFDEAGTGTNLKDGVAEGNEVGEQQQQKVGGVDENAQGGTTVDRSASAEEVQDDDDKSSTRTANQKNTPLATPTTTATATTEEEDGNKDKHWISERVVGGFERHFRFSSDVDQDAVKASLKNGILSIVVPKIVKRQKRIVIDGGD